jgi:hypothetical protein
MNEEELQDIRELFSYFWELNSNSGLVGGSQKIADDVKTGTVSELTRNMVIAHALVARFYNGSQLAEENWEEAKGYLLQDKN